MADWMTVRVVLAARDGTAIPQAAGRVILARADHTFAQFAQAIDTAFGRWDLTPVHEFDVDGRRLLSDVTADQGDTAEASDGVRLGEAHLRPSTPFSYVFDLGENWQHRCDVESLAVDVGRYGGEPQLPVAVFGWGTIPDQYGREREEDDEESGGPVIPTAHRLDGPTPDDLAWTEEDEEDFLAAWEQQRRDAWEVVETAVAEVDRRQDDGGLARAADQLRRSAGSHQWPYDILWAAAGAPEPSDEDETLWISAASGVVEPQGDLPVEDEVASAWIALEPADWAGAIIELIRAGIGQSANPDDLVPLIERCPEIEGPPFSSEDATVIALGFSTVVELWRVLGAVDQDFRLTALGRWGLPEALRRAWAADGD